MAADCVTRVWALAIATAACIGLPSALVYAIVRLAATRRYGATFALGLVLVFWVTVSAAYYPRVCADLVPWLRFLRRARDPISEPSLLVLQPSSFATRGVMREDHRGGGMLFPWEAPAPAARVGPRLTAAASDVLRPQPYPCRMFGYEVRRVPLAQRPHGDRGGGGGMFPWEAPAAAARGGARAGDDVPPPPPLYPSYPSYEQQRAVPLAQSHGDDRASTSRMMAALPREPPAARGKALVGTNDDDVPGPPCEEQSDGGPSKYCAICMTDVDKEETEKRLPLCLHVFHRHCIDQWLQGHSTCPICRCNAFLTDSCMSLYGR